MFASFHLPVDYFPATIAELFCIQTHPNIAFAVVSGFNALDKRVSLSRDNVGGCRLQALKELIESRLVTRKYCGITQKNLVRCWPAWPDIDTTERERRLQLFATKNGWIARISAAGDRVTFRKPRA